MKLKWQQAPVKTQWGDDMVVASVAIDKDHTVCLYCERDQTPKVDVMFAQRTWVGLTDDDKCVKELYESDTDPEWIDGYTAGLKDAENKLRRYNAQPALVVEQLNPVAEVKLKQQGGNAGFATVINEMYEIIEMLCLDAEAAHGIKGQP